MKKSTFLKIAGVSAMLSIMAPMPAFAGKWKLDEQNKWYWYGEVSTANSWMATMMVFTNAIILTKTVTR